VSNAVKFTRSCAAAEIEVGSAAPTAGGDEAIFVRDNGVEGRDLLSLLSAKLGRREVSDAAERGGSRR
jgi:hypothetical protein